MNEKRPSNKIHSTTKTKIRWIFIVSLIMLLIPFIKTLYIMNNKGEEYSKKVLSKQIQRNKDIPYKRGTIYDRNGVVLALSEKRFTVVLDVVALLQIKNSNKDENGNGKDNPEYMFNVEKTAEFFGLTKEFILEKIENNPNSQYVVLKRKVTAEEVNAYEEYKASLLNQKEESNRLKCIYFETQYYRRYPFDSLASHVIGYSNSVNTGLEGIESYYNDILNGTNGIQYYYMDSELNAQTTVKEPEDGSSLVSTIDVRIQRAVERNVEQFNETYGAENVGVIVMDPNNGEILAMACNYEYNLNDPTNLEYALGEEKAAEYSGTSEEQKQAAQNARYAVWRNFCVNDGYTPGSTFKTITVSSALEENAVTTNDSFYCAGKTIVAGRRLSCNNIYGHGNISLAESLMKSCNCALITIADGLGSKEMLHYENLFGFGKRTGIDLPGETYGLIYDEKQLNVTELATSSYGQGLTVSMVQMAAAYASIINGGSYYTPHVVKSIVDSEGNPVKTADTAAVRKTVSKTTSEFIRKALYKTVTDGTGKAAAVEGYLVGGKTGTARKLIQRLEGETDEEYKARTKYVVSFMGFAPADNPQVLVYVVLDEIHDQEKKDKSSVAGAMVSEILKETLPYLEIYPDGEIEYKTELFELLPENPDYLPEYDESAVNEDEPADGNGE